MTIYETATQTTQNAKRYTVLKCTQASKFLIVLGKSIYNFERLGTSQRLTYIVLTSILNVYF